VELLVIDADATLVLAHSDRKEGAAGTYKHSFGFAPLLAYLDRGQAPGEPLAGLLRPGNAAPGAADDLIALVDLALAQLPRSAGDQPVLVRSDSAGASTRLAWHLREREVAFTLGMPIDAHVREAILAQPEPAWTPAIDPSGQVRPSAEVCELTGWIDLHTWPAGTGRSAEERTPTPAPSCASATTTGTASRSSSPTRPIPTSPGWSCGTANALGSRTASAPPRPPGWATSPSTCCAATPSGWSWSWPPKTSPAGPRRCCSTAPSPSPSPRRCATGCCTSPPASSAMPAARSCGCSAPGHGPLLWRARSLGCRPCRCAANPPSNADGLPPTGATPPCPPAAPGTLPARTPAPAAPGLLPERPPDHPTAAQAAATTPS
jgi:Transposase DDE domain group 1